MKRKLIVACTALVALALNVGAASVVPKIDLGGTWVLDASRSESVPRGMEQTLMVTMAEDKIDIELKIKLPDGNERVIKDSYLPNGQQVEFTPPAPPGQTPPKGKRTVTWTERGIEIKDERPVQTPEGPETVYDTRRWTLSADGTLLIVEQKSITPTGTQQSRRTFVKKA
ncbi:MAG: hypothetical protein ACRD9R_22305 [Pyrinomonadaceae bacterium]